MSDLPDGWTCTTIKELAGTTGLFVDGDWIESKDQDPNGSIRLLQLADIGDGTFLDKSNRWINEDAFVRLRCTALTTGDVLVGRMPDPLGRACLMPALEQRCVTVVDVAALRVDSENIDNRWVMQTINSPQIRAEIAAQSSGTTRRRISRGRLGEMEIPLPPKAEQTRIANQLDTLLTRVQACNDRFDAIPALLKRLRQTITNAACSGELSAEWRGTSDLKGWKSQALGNVCNSITDGDHQAPLQSDSGVPFITISAMNDGRLRLEKASRFVPQSYFDSLRPMRRPARGDLLFSVTGSIGIPALVDTDLPFTFQRHIAILKPNKSLVFSSFIALALGSEAMRTQVMEVATGTAQLTIPLSGIRAFVLNLPPIDEQTEIVRRVEALFALADRIEARCTAARAKSQRLTPLVLAKAFRGELVPQDPNDEPASALLARMASSNTAAAGQNKRKVPVALKECAQAAINV